MDLTVKLLLKWPNLFYSPTAFAPKRYPDAIVRYANTRGADKIIFGGYYPWGFELERIFGELDAVAFGRSVAEVPARTRRRAPAWTPCST